MPAATHVFAAFAVVALAVACSSSSEVAVARAALAAGCARNSDCDDKLVCVFAHCHVQCTSARDCEGRACVAAAPIGGGVCQLEGERACARNVDCPGTQLCGSDGQCRDACANERDCRDGESCLAGQCVGPQSRVLAEKAAPGAAGDACRYASDCAGELVCLRGRCDVECVGDRDCIVGWTCAATRCHPPGQALPVPACGTTDTGATFGSAVEISAEAGLRCAVRPDGDVYCWGEEGRIGGGYSSPTPKKVPLPAGVRATHVSSNGDPPNTVNGVSSHACAVTTTGDVYCWGYDTRTATDLPLPVKIDGLPPVQTISATRDTDCVLAGKDVYCWGNPAPRLVRTPVPTRVEEVSGLALVLDGSTEFQCVLRSDAKIVCWGATTNFLGTNGVFTPTVVEDLGTDEPVSLTAGANHICVLLKRGAIECFGRNDLGQLGNGTTNPSSTPFLVEAAVGTWTQVSAGHGSTCAVRSDGALACWGNDEHFGGNPVTTPTLIEDIPKPVSYVATQDGITCARAARGLVYCWGSEIGNGAAGRTSVPTLVTLPCK